MEVNNIIVYQQNNEALSLVVHGVGCIIVGSAYPTTNLYITIIKVIPYSCILRFLTPPPFGHRLS
jgi:hypothetical protein